MKVGDKVRLIHGKEEGRIVSIISNKEVEVEIEDGFRIPALKTELVIVASEETLVVSEGDSFSHTHAPWNGVYLAFTPFNDQTYELNLVNDTGYTTYFTVGEEKSDSYKGVYSGVLEKTSFAKLSEVNIKNFDEWPEFVIQLLFFAYGTIDYRMPLVKKIRFRSASFFKSKKVLGLLNKEAYVFRLDQDALKIDARSLEENLNDTKAAPVVAVSRPAREVDLHIEKLTETPAGMSNSAMLALQLNVFHTSLENALATGMDEIIFIHGVGNGVLKKEIHKALSANKTIKFFQDAQKEKFGYGATLVRLKN
jgi:hypothetical protein